MAEETEVSVACEGDAVYRVHVSEAKRSALAGLLDNTEAKFSKLGLKETHNHIRAIRDELAAPVEQITVYYRFRPLTQTLRDEWGRRLPAMRRDEPLREAMTRP